jgi:hypothetical protein
MAMMATTQQSNIMYAVNCNDHGNKRSLLRRIARSDEDDS